MIALIIFVILLLLIAVTLFFILRMPPAPSTKPAEDNFFPDQKCTPTLNQVDEYAATYIVDSDGDCVPNTCKPGYNLYYSDPKSINKFKRCQ